MLDTITRSLKPLCLTPLLIFSVACGSSKKQASVSEAAPSTYGAQMAGQEQQIERAIEKGEVDTWVASPVYLGDEAIMAIYRGPKPSDPAKTSQYMRSSLSASDVSKISWRSSYTYQDTLLNMMRITQDGEELLFADTPHAFAEFVFLTRAKPAAPSAAASPAEPPAVVTQKDGEHTIHVVLHQPTPTQPIVTPPATGPQLVTAPSAPNHVARHFNTWALPELDHEVALGCAVLRSERAGEDGETIYTYRGEIWLRDLADGRTFKHTDARLEPVEWQLHPGDRPQLEVTMADEKGWPSRVDFIDLNTFEVRSMPTREKLKQLGVK